MKITVRDCNKGESQSKELPVPQSKLHPESATFKSTTRKCHNQSTVRECNNHKDSQGMPQTNVHQSKVYTEIASIKSTSSEFTMKRTVNLI